MKIIRKQIGPKFVKRSELRVGAVYVDSGGYLSCRNAHQYTEDKAIRVKNLDFEIPEDKVLPLSPEDKWTVHDGEVEIEFAEPKTVEIGSLEENQWFIDPSDSSATSDRVYVRDNYEDERGCYAYMFKNGKKRPDHFLFNKSHQVIPIPEPTIIIGDEDENKDKE